jgi:hypothetical protein
MIGASRIRCGEIKIGGGGGFNPPLPLAIHKYPSLSRVNCKIIYYYVTFCVWEPFNKPHCLVALGTGI